MAYDLGEPATPSLEIRDSAGTLAAGGAVSATITLPDGVTVKSSPGDFTIGNPSTGLYRVAGFTTSVGGLHPIFWTVTGANAGTHADSFRVRSTVPIVSLVEAKNLLRHRAPDPSRDEELRDVIEAATVACEDHAGRRFRRTTVTETYDGGDVALALRTTPVQSITSVTVNGSAITDYVPNLASGLLYRGTTTAPIAWPDGLQNVTVVYVAGSPNVTAAVIEAIQVTIEDMWGPRRGGTDRGAEDRGGARPYALTFRAEKLLATSIGAGFA